LREYVAFEQPHQAVLNGGYALYPTATATCVRVPGGDAGEPIVSDGVYAETKEALTGFFLLECADLDEVIAVAARIPAARYGTIEVRPVHPPSESDDGAGDTAERLVREERARVLATLIPVTGDIDPAEDAVPGRRRTGIGTVATRRRPGQCARLADSHREAAGNRPSPPGGPASRQGGGGDGAVGFRS
jgi:hypothetical protein